LKDKVVDSNKIRKIRDDKYLNLKDFCRIQKDFLFLDENGMKQFLFQKKALKKKEDKYIPNDNQVIAIEKDGELYMFYNYLRSVLTMRSFAMIGDDDDILKFVQKYTSDKDVIIEQLSNMVLIDYKQNSFEFRNCMGSTYLENKGGK
jgi:hypothetical protein